MQGAGEIIKARTQNSKVLPLMFLIRTVNAPLRQGNCKQGSCWWMVTNQLLLLTQCLTIRIVSIFNLRGLQYQFSPLWCAWSWGFHPTSGWEDSRNRPQLVNCPDDALCQESWDVLPSTRGLPVVTPLPKLLVGVYAKTAGVTPGGLCKGPRGLILASTNDFFI